MNTRLLADDPEVDVAGRPIRERRPDAGHQAHRSEVYVLIEFAAELDQRVPQRDVIGNAVRPPAGAEEQAIVPTDPLLPVGGHPRADLVVLMAAPVELVERKLDAELATGRFEHTNSLRHDLPADAVAGDDCDAMSCHGGRSV